jgi:plasmid maintenance system antidote protein VapI
VPREIVLRRDQATVRGGVSPDTALRLARYFGTSAEFWLNLQLSYDLSKARLEEEKQIAREVQVYAG